ncbi:BNR repeat domain protein [Minicystis rosea]|nr:BNR repeat domain protein [Minicystis rosea]
MTSTVRPLVLGTFGLALVACGSGGTASSTTGSGGTTSSTTSTTGTGGAPGGNGTGGSLAVDECENGTAECDPNADCIDTPAYYTCACKPGYEGDGKTCTDIDECQAFLADCDPNASCTNLPGSYSCACPLGFEGDGKTCAAVYTAVAAGQFHACAIRADKTMWCWGHNTSGQAGTGTSDPIFLRPAPAGNGTDWIQVGAGASFTCALDGSKQISCWGTNGAGQLGDGTVSTRLSPTPMTGGISDWTTLEVGNNHSCALRQDGSVWCWGANTRGQIGDGTNTNATAPTAVSMAGPWTSVSAGVEFTCAVKADHTLWCWGLDTSRQLGDGKTTNSNIPVQEKTLATDWASVSAGSAYACGLKLDGRRYCWGTNSLGQGGDTTILALAQPTAADTVTSWSRIDAGDLAACALRTDGTLWCWGDGSLGQTAQPGAEGPLLTPAQVGTDSDWTAIASGLRFACGLRQGGHLHCWGNASRAALGLGYGSDRSDPSPVGTAADWADVRVQLDDGCAIRTNGDLHCWGRNVLGTLGDGTTVTRKDPVPVGAGKVWKRVALGRTHTCGIAAADATEGVYCWGADASGEQGNGTAGAQLTPSPITAPTGIPTAWISLAAGFNHTCAVGQNGALWCWGRNASGQLGDASTTNRTDPKQVLPTGAADWIEVSAGGDYTCALRAAGTLFCWGANGSGQLGTGDIVSPVTAPTQIGTTAWAAIAAGQTHTCAVSKTGTLSCWGLNTSGQIGLGNTTSPVLVPTQVGTDTDWARPIVGQGPSTCALKTNGDLYCWGAGSYGQLGQGSLAGSTSPKKVPSTGPWKAASFGNEHACGIGGDGLLLCWGASYGAQLGSGLPIVSTPSPVLDPF